MSGLADDLHDTLIDFGSLIFSDLYKILFDVTFLNTRGTKGRNDYGKTPQTTALQHHYSFTTYTYTSGERAIISIILAIVLLLRLVSYIPAFI